jgi:hypothetical protein
MPVLVEQILIPPGILKMRAVAAEPMGVREGSAAIPGIRISAAAAKAVPSFPQPSIESRWAAEVVRERVTTPTVTIKLVAAQAAEG